MKDVFKDWHNDMYFSICYMNLYEKYLCGGISPEEWDPIFSLALERELKERKYDG